VKGLRRDMDNPKMQLVPMIDIVFQLLVFFFLGTHFRVPEGELDAYLPTGQGREPGPIDEIRVMLRVSQAGVGNAEVPPSVVVDKQACSMANLEARLQRLASDRRVRERVPVVIEAEPRVAYRWVIETLNLCRRAEFSKVSFAASKRNAAPAGGPSS